MKAGETYLSDNPEFDKDPFGYLLNESARPRCIMVPDPDSFGIIQAIISTLWSTIKVVFPEFIHSYTKDQFKQKLFDSIRDDFCSLSMDGSAWDSTQWPDL